MAGLRGLLIDDERIAQRIPVIVVALHRDVVEVTLVLSLVGPYDDEIPVRIHGHVGLVLRIRVVGVRLLGVGVAVGIRMNADRGTAAGYPPCTLDCTGGSTGIRSPRTSR